ncbi:MAG TPA: MEDS domain-containing protein, partial [Candidatus Eisenbacteria bacterium]|nr:MEDS domain-containing protein [Candidatus Eisenbacteria bacterium]
MIECSPSLVRSHDHVCLVYDDPEEQLSVVLPLFCEGLSARERCVWVLDDLPMEVARRALEGAGIDVARHVNDGSLVLWRRPEWRPHTLRPDERLAEVRALVERTVADGHAGIRFAIDMTWTLDPDIPADQLEAWEARLDSLFDGSLPVRMICQYGQRRLGPDVVQAGLRTHRRVALDGQVCDNPFYDVALPAGGDATGVAPPTRGPATAWMLRQLHASVADQTELKSARRSLEMQLAVARVLADATSLELAAPRLLSAICAGGGWDAG